MKRKLVAGATALALLFGSAGAIAKDIPATGVTIDEVVAWLQGGGYKAQIQTTSDGDRNVESASNGVDFHVFLYDCKNARCGSLQFSYGLDTKGAWTADKLNAWNRDNRWTKAYVDKVNDPWLEYDVDLTPGGTYELLDDEFLTWRNALNDFCKLVPC
jgi:Putative bacterial sensory transduction regulator